MKKRSAIFAMLLVLGAVAAMPQKKPSRSVRNATPAKKTEVKRVPRYQMNLRIVSGAKYSVSFSSRDGDGYMDPENLNSLIADLLNGASSHSEPSNTLPNVVIEPSPNITMLNLWNPITLFPRDRSQLTIQLSLSAVPGATAFPVLLNVPWITENPPFDVKPDPLLLIVTVDDGGKLYLNSEQYGTLSDPGPLSKRLSRLFDERETNGILRPNTNEIEKTVTIVLPMSERKVAELMTIARAVWLPNGKPINLVMENPLAPTDERLQLDDLPPVPAKRPK